MAGPMSAVADTLGNKLARGSVAVLKKGVNISAAKVPFLATLQRYGAMEKIEDVRFQQPITYVAQSIQQTTRRTAMSAAVDDESAICGSVVEQGVVVDFHYNDAKASKVVDNVTKGTRSLLMGLEAQVFSNGDGSTTLAGLRTALPMADTGAYYNIPATRTNFTAAVLHNWITTSSRGARTSTLLGATSVVTDFCHSESGVLARVGDFKMDAMSRGYSDFINWCSFTMQKYLSMYLKAHDMLTASYVSLPKMPDEYKIEGLRILDAGATFIKFDDVLWLPTANLYTTTYDCILTPMMQDDTTIKLLYYIGDTKGQEKVTIKEGFFTMFPFKRDAKNLHYEAPIICNCALLIQGLSGCACIKSNGLYESGS